MAERSLHAPLAMSVLIAQPLLQLLRQLGLPLLHQLMLPEPEHLPARSLQTAIHFAIPQLVALELRIPERLVLFWSYITLRTAVPVTTIDVCAS
jgi:hypothetical protein